MSTIAESEKSSPSREDRWERLLSLRGAGKDFFAQHGGAEKVIQDERAEFDQANQPIICSPPQTESAPS